MNLRQRDTEGAKRPPSERRLKAGEMLVRSISSESPSSSAAKGTKEFAEQTDECGGWSDSATCSSPVR